MKRKSVAVYLYWTSYHLRILGPIKRFTNDLFKKIAMGSEGTAVTYVSERLLLVALDCIYSYQRHYRYYLWNSYKNGFVDELRSFVVPQKIIKYIKSGRTVSIRSLVSSVGRKFFNVPGTYRQTIYLCIFVYICITYLQVAHR